MKLKNNVNLKYQPLEELNETSTILMKIVIMKGETLFSLMDSQGIPLDSMIQTLRTNGMKFGAKGFILAALKSKNYTYTTVKKVLLQEMITDEEIELVNKLMP
jgi:alanyl-tRNA synthetase